MIDAYVTGINAYIAAMLGVSSLVPRQEAPAPMPQAAALPAPARSAPPADTVEVFSGTKRSEQTLDH